MDVAFSAACRVAGDCGSNAAAADDGGDRRAGMNEEWRRKEKKDDDAGNSIEKRSRGSSGSVTAPRGVVVVVGAFSRDRLYDLRAPGAAPSALRLRRISAGGRSDCCELFGMRNGPYFARNFSSVPSLPHSARRPVPRGYYPALCSSCPRRTSVHLARYTRAPA